MKFVVPPLLTNSSYLALSAGTEVQFSGGLLPVHVWDLLSPRAPDQEVPGGRGDSGGGGGCPSPAAGGWHGPLLGEGPRLLLLVVVLEVAVHERVAVAGVLRRGKAEVWLLG